MSVIGRILVAACLIAVLLAVGCSSGDSSPEATVSIATSATSTPAPAETTAPQSTTAETTATTAPESPTAAPAMTTGAFRFELPSATGGEVALESYLGDRNVVVVFYRGFW